MYLIYRKEYQKEKVWFVPVKNNKTFDLSDVDIKLRKFYCCIKTNTNLSNKDIKKYLPDQFIKKFGVVLVTKS
jgi:hypothetical protein